ncbi:MAG: lamin tail domain-containing protein, partial [Acidobacteria bacterium]|nr:lamin tail domain-containing protein [Acidobacteriota bacterium]
IICGPFGSGSGGLGLFGATSMDINPSDNPNVKAHVWRTGQTHNNLRVTFATSEYGTGRVAAVGDSSPADDGTGDSGDTLYNGWDKASGGVNNREIFLNATYFLSNPAPDNTPPVITAGPSSNPKDCSAVISWSTDEAANSIVEYGLTDSYGMSQSNPTYVKSHSIEISNLNPSTTYHFRVLSTDSKGNGPTASSDFTFVTSANSAPIIVSSPTISSFTSTTAKIVWQTDEEATSLVEYGTTGSYGNSAFTSGYFVNHEVVISGLTPQTTYHFRVVSSDRCGNGPTYSSDAVFTTLSPALDISGWTIKQYNSTQTFTFPQGTTIPQNGYLVLARNVTRAQFEAQWPSMPSETVFVNSNPNGSCPDGCFPMINGSEVYELYNSSNTLIDGPTISISTSNSYQRKNPSDNPSLSASWNVFPAANATPGSGAGALSGKGVVINEMADSSNFSYEFIELFNDGGTSIPDTIPPERVSDLAVYPNSSNSLKLEWTAPGDDGMSGTASSYSIRYSLSPIQTEADFQNATPLSSAPSPVAGGSKQSLIVSGLSIGEVYFFAMKTSDEVPNTSALSNCSWALVQEAGSQQNPVNHLLISQIRVSGSNDDVVELFNPTASPISLSGYSIQYFAANSNFGFKVNLNSSKSVPALGWYLICLLYTSPSP